MNKQEKVDKGGRPRKVTYDELRKVVDDYFLYVAEGDASILNKKGRFVKLAEYAQGVGLNYKDTDFRRCAPIVQYIDEIIKKYDTLGNDEGSCVPAYVPLDIDYFLRPTITAKKRLHVLMERDNYYQRLHISAAKALEIHKTICDENEKMRHQLVSNAKRVEGEAQAVQGLTQENKKLAAENRYLKRYIHNYVEPAFADAVLTGNTLENLATKAAAVLPSKVKQAAVVSLDEFLEPDGNLLRGGEDSIEQLL